MKVCRQCKVEKELDKFYKHSKMADGHLNKCIVCVKENVKNYRLLNLEKVKLEVKKRAKDPNRVASKKKYEQSEKGKLAKKRAMDSYKERYPMKRASHIMVGSALLTGKIVKPNCCSECNSSKKIEAHHDDYTKPMELRWLCEKCHKEWHKHNKAIYS
jgi:hypothetical protein